MTKKRNILLISPSKEMAILAQKMMQEHRIQDVEIEEALFTKEAIKICMQAEGTKEAIISLPFTASQIQKHTDLPVITLEIGLVEVFQVFLKVKEAYDAAGFIAYKEERIRNGIMNLGHLLGENFRILPFYFEKYSDIERCARQVMTHNAKAAVVTGYCMKAAVENFSIKGLIVNPGVDSFLDSIQRAREILAFMKRDQERGAILETILDLSNDGIINIDDNNVIQFLNKSALELLKASRQTLLKKDIARLEDPKLKNILEFTASDDTLEAGKIYSLGNKTFAVSKKKLPGKEKNYMIVLQDITHIQKLEQSIRRKLSQKGLLSKYSFEDIIGESRAIKNCIALAKKYCKSNHNILIHGETGTGKELFAHSIHNESYRKNGPFVAINCATLPENLLESELFGYDPGTFTGGKREGKEGLLELAHGGTIFLDEIGDLPLHLQPRLLRVLQDKEVRRLGGNKIVPIDVRIISSTNKDLNQLVQQNKYRDDLYYRLSTLTIEIPPLREREGDVSLIFELLLKGENVDFECLPDELISFINSYSWPGNIRELQSLANKVSCMGTKAEIEELILQDFLLREKPNAANSQDGTLQVKIDNLGEMEKEIISKLIGEKGFTKNQITKILGVSRTTVWRRLKDEPYNGKAV